MNDPKASAASPDYGDAKSEFSLHDVQEENMRYVYGYEKAYMRKRVLESYDLMHLSGLRDHYRHKKQWSHIVALYLLAMIVFQCVLIRNVGLDHWNFEKYDWLLPVLLVQNLGQIVSLAYIVVKSLFRDM